MKKAYEFVRDVVVRFLNHNCGINAAGLTYFTLLAVMPVLCCILVVAKIAGVDQFAKAQINSRIDAAITNIENGQEEGLAKLAPQSAEARERKRIAAHEFADEARQISNALFERVEKFDFGTFGWIGFALLLWTVISTLSQVETSFNGIWEIAKGRPLWKCVYTYLFVLIVLPIFVAGAMSMPILNLIKIAKVDSAFFRLALTMLASSLLFGFMYWLMPNCRVRFLRAWLGGLITAVGFCLWFKLCAIAQIGIAHASALYGTFAFLPIVLAWVYMSWQIVLFGGCIVCELDQSARQSKIK